LQAYRLGGEAGLQPKCQDQGQIGPGTDDRQYHRAEAKHPPFDIKRISQLLRRWFFLPATPAESAAAVHAPELMASSSSPKKRSITRPRFFERATPNQIWQTDFFTVVWAEFTPMSSPSWMIVPRPIATFSEQSRSFYSIFFF
jgi:hypothetical protein